MVQVLVADRPEFGGDVDLRLCRKELLWIICPGLLPTGMGRMGEEDLPEHNSPPRRSQTKIQRNLEDSFETFLKLVFVTKMSLAGTAQ